MNISDVSHIIKMKGAGFTALGIAKKMGITVEQVNFIVTEHTRALQNLQEVGYGDLVNTFTIMCHQYQLLGETMKIIAGALSKSALSEDLRPHMDKDPEQTIKNLQAHFILIKPFALDPSVVEKEILGEPGKN